MSKYGVIFWSLFSCIRTEYEDLLRKYGSEKTPYLDTFHAVGNSHLELCNAKPTCESISYIGDMGNEVVFHFFNGWYKRCQRIQAFNIIWNKFPIIGAKNVSDPVPYLSVITHFERSFLLFHVSYTEFWFNGKTSFMRIGRKSIKTSYNSVARDYKLLWCTELNCLFLVVLHKTMHCHCILSEDVFNVAG